MLIFSDPHLREDSAEVVLGEVLPGILEACITHGQRELACLGDMYHFRYRIDVRIQNQVREWLKRVTSSGISFYFLPGNHDQVDFNGRNALEVFADIPGVKVFTEPTWTSHGLWIPYRKRPADIAAALLIPRPQEFMNAGKVLFMHHGVQGALMNSTLVDTEGLPQEMFTGWDRILCGHYHKRQTLGPLTYIGSPWQTKADEAGQPKGYAIWEKSSLDFVDTNWGPRYFNIRLTEGPIFDVSGIQPRDIVHVTTAPGIDSEKTGKLLASHNIHAVVTPEVQVAEARISLPDGSSLENYVKEYVRLSDTVLDKDRLLQIFREVVGQ